MTDVHWNLYTTISVRILVFFWNIDQLSAMLGHWYCMVQTGDTASFRAIRFRVYPNVEMPLASIITSFSVRSYDMWSRLVKMQYGQIEYERKPCIFSIITIVYTSRPLSHMKVRESTRTCIWWPHTHISATDTASITRENVYRVTLQKMRDTGSSIAAAIYDMGYAPVA